MPLPSILHAVQKSHKEYLLYVVLVVLICILIFKNDSSTAIGIAITICLLIIAIGPENIASASFGPKGFEWQRVKAETDRNSELISRFIFLLMPMGTYRNLRKIASGNFGKFKMPNDMKQQLRYLRDNGFITVRCAVGDLPTEGEQLSDYVDATESGRIFIEIRDKLQSSGQSLSEPPRP